MSPRAHQAIEHIIYISAVHCCLPGLGHVTMADTYVFVGEWIWGCAEVGVVLDVIRLETDSFVTPMCPPCGSTTNSVPSASVAR
jgi:hypothetical protein